MTNIFIDILYALVGFGKWLYEFCTATITVGTFNINVLTVFSGVGLTALVIAGLVKALIPVA